ncbi:MAG: clostripain-related cysteine peptidase [Candidatus Xenobia bacterium]
MQVQRADWSVLIYSSASADILAAAKQSLAEIQHLPEDTRVGAWLGTPEGIQQYQDQRISTAPAADMADPETLRRFLAWGTAKFPARHTLLVIGGHGGGFLGAVEDSQRRHLMRPDDMARVLRQSGLSPDVLVLNACLMAQAEVALQFDGQARCLVAAPAEEHGAGLPLGAALAALPAGPTAPAVARALVDASARTPERTPAVSALDMTHLPGLLDALDGLGAALVAHPELMPAVRSMLQQQPGYREVTWDVPLTQLKDLGTFCDAVQQLPALHQPALALRRAIDDTVLAHEGRGDGLSAWLPDCNLRSKLGPMSDMVTSLYGRLTADRLPHWLQAVRLLSDPAGKVDCTLAHQKKIMPISAGVQPRPPVDTGSCM